MTETPAPDQAIPLGVIALGGSAGGVEALKKVVSGLPMGLPFAVLAALHMAPGTPSVLPAILDRCGPWRACAARDGEALRPGHVYVAVPDRHLLVDDGRIVVSHGPTEGGHRPAINALFRSVAVAHDSRAVGVLLSGVLDDGVVGLDAIAARGGVTVVQDPDDALFPAMPLNALAAMPIDHVVSAEGAGRLFAKLAEEPRGREVAMQPHSNIDAENRIAMGRGAGSRIDAEALGPPSGYTCPDCNGSLMSVGTKSYRCRVGHAWTDDSLLLARDKEAESALWIAVRSLEEKARLSRRLAAGSSPGALRSRYAEIAGEAEHAMMVLRDRLSDLAPTIAQPGEESRDEPPS